MRALTVLAVALSLTLLPHALAGPDRERDTTLSAPFSATADAVIDCESRAADITFAWAYADGAAVRAGLSIADIEDRMIKCSYRGGWTATEGYSAVYWAALDSPGETDELGFNAGGFRVSFDTRVTSDDVSHCVRIGTESWVSPCLGESARYGSNLTWSVPLQGAFVEEDGGVRSYDLAGRQFFGSATATVYAQEAPVSVRDTASIDPVQS